MADAVVALEAANILSLGSSFIPQGVAESEDQEFGRMIKANGDFQKFSDPFNNITSGVAAYTWSEDTGLGAALSALCGTVQNAFMITEIQAVTAFNAYPALNFTFHNHVENEHAAVPLLNAYAIPADMIAILTGAFGAYDFLGKSSATVCIQNGTYRIFVNHPDAECGTGNHFVGQNIGGEEEAICQYLGNAATPTTIAGWSVTNSTPTDSNDTFDISSITASRLVLRT